MKLGGADVSRRLLPGTPASGVAPLVEDPFGGVPIPQLPPHLEF